MVLALSKPEGWYSIPLKTKKTKKERNIFDNLYWAIWNIQDKQYILDTAGKVQPGSKAKFVFFSWILFYIDTWIFADQQ